MKSKITQIYIGIFALFLMTVGIVGFSSLIKAEPMVASKQTPPGQIALVPLVSSSTLRAEAVEQTAPTEAESTPAAPSAPETKHAEPKVKASTNNVTKAAAPAPKPAAPKTATCGGSFSEQFLCLLNNYRTSKGLGKLSGSGNLSKVALAHSIWMATTDTFSHTGENGSRLGDRCKLAGISCRAENLAHNAKSAQNLLDMWIASSSHNKNLLGPYSTAGLGISGSYITLLMN